jgi:NAD(P)-dependent dehydrogenase (short-subunit alcohol dehydrogenase family)
VTLTSETAGSEITNPDGIGPVDPAAAPVARATRGVGTVLVTGAASGLGRAVAAAVTAAGGRALLVDRVAVEDGPEGALATVTDLSDTAAAEDAIRALIDQAGGVDAVVTAAGTDRCGALGDVPAAEWERVVAVNLFGTAAVIRAALPALKESRGKIVTIASTLGLKALPDATAYCASKFGVIGLTQAVADEVKSFGVKVQALMPGAVATPFWEQNLPAPMPGDAMPPERVADLIVFMLLQPEDSMLVGPVITPVGARRRKATAKAVD